MANKKTKSKVKIREKKSLIITNLGDTVVIKNRSALGAGILGALIMISIVAIAVKMRDAWSSPVFWGVFAFLFICSAYWFATSTFGRIVLSSAKMTMTVYNPFEKTYNFKDVNYVEKKADKPKDGLVLHTVYAYIGKGRRNVSVATFSAKEADEVESLLKGMLDSAAMEYPEGNEEPFELPKKEKKTSGLFASLKKRSDKPEVKAEPESPIENDSIEFVTKETHVPSKTEHKSVIATDEDELGEYEAHLIHRQNKHTK